MPCYRCGVRQTDPGRGQSPWKRGVRRDSQVLICPGCQADADDWTADLDRCARCGSVHLVRRLGEVECRDCGMIVPPADETDRPGTAPALGADPGLGAAVSGAAPVALTDTARNPDLSEEVARALERVLRQGLVGSSGLVSQHPHRTGTADHR